MEASFAGEAFAPHRHDTYALGITMRGVQSFRYRGEERHSPAGHCIILHPDELHDGAAGDERGLVYRMLYVEPSRLVPAFEEAGGGLPFVAQPVMDHAPLTRLLATALADLDDRPDELESDGFLSLLAATLTELSGRAPRPTGRIPHRQVIAVRDFLAAHYADNIGSAALEEIAGIDRFSLTRQFRSLFGTTPHRFMIMRRLAAARDMMLRGQSLAEVAAGAGFADQAHLTRHFKKTYGMTPGRWLALAQRGSEMGARRA